MLNSKKIKPPNSLHLRPYNAQCVLNIQGTAKVLNISCLHLIKLLASGDIAYSMTGSHCNIELKNIMVYKELMKTNRRNFLDFLVQESQELNLGYI